MSVNPLLNLMGIFVSKFKSIPEKIQVAASDFKFNKYVHGGRLFIYFISLQNIFRTPFSVISSWLINIMLCRLM